MFHPNGRCRGAGSCNWQACSSPPPRPVFSSSASRERRHRLLLRPLPWEGRCADWDTPLEELFREYEYRPCCALGEPLPWLVERRGPFATSPPSPAPPPGSSSPHSPRSAFCGPLYISFGPMFPAFFKLASSAILLLGGHTKKSLRIPYSGPAGNLPTCRRPHCGCGSLLTPSVLPATARIIPRPANPTKSGENCREKMPCVPKRELRPLRERAVLLHARGAHLAGSCASLAYLVGSHLARIGFGP